MSFEAAIGQIDQILTWQQQILDPATASQSSATSGTDSASSADGTASTDFATALAEAQGSTVDAATGVDGTDTSSLLDGGDSQLISLLSAGSADGAGSLGTTSSAGASNPQVQAMISEANSLVGKPYVWGGGHSGWGAQQGYDCSGFVSAVLHAGGYLSSPQDTTTLPSAAGIEQGPGQYVTIYDRDAPGEEGHVIISIDGQFYESGGEHGSWGGGGGVEKIATPSAAYLATFNDVLHPSGL
jgi:cell wall-associated NlpC family hydrolase